MLFSLQQWICARWPRSQRFVRRHKKLLAACLAVTLTSAWAPSANALTIRTSVTPTQTISHAYVLYFIHFSSAFPVSHFYATELALGTLPGQQTTTFVHDFPDIPTEQVLSPPLSVDLPAGYVIFGLHGEPGNEGVSLSFPNDAPIRDGATWDTLLRPFIRDNVSEADWIADFLTPGEEDEGLEISALESLGAFNSELFHLLRTPLGSTATLVNFSTAQAGGFAQAVVPEPGCSSILITGAGAWLLTRRRK